MENRRSWQKTAVALFDKATARFGEDARQLQDAMFWLRGRPAGVAEANVPEWVMSAHAERARS